MTQQNVCLVCRVWIIHLVQQLRNSWCATAVSFLLYVAVVTRRDQRQARSFMAFFITNNALTPWLSSSTPTGAMALSKVMACSGAFSQTSFSDFLFPSCSGVNVTQKNRERFDGKIKKRGRTVSITGKSGRGWGGYDSTETLLPCLTPTSSEGNSSKQGMCFQTQRQQNAGCRHETSKWTILTSEAFQMLEELPVLGQREQRERTEGTHRLLTTRTGTKPERPSPPRMPAGSRSLKAVIPHLSTCIWNLNAFKIYQLLLVCFILRRWKKKDVKRTNSSCWCRKGREATDKAHTSPLLRRLGLQQVLWKKQFYALCLTERFSSANQRLAWFFGDLSCVVTRWEGCPHFPLCCSHSFLEH